MHEPVLAIDLGATFTKVAWRPRPDGADVWWSQRLDLAQGWEGRGLVPSAFARGRSDGAWAFGYDAYAKDGAEWETFGDWKRQLFVDGDEHALWRLRPALAEFLTWIGRAARGSGPRAFSRVVVTVPLLDDERAR